MENEKSFTILKHIVLNISDLMLKRTSKHKTKEKNLSVNNTLTT